VILRSDFRTCGEKEIGGEDWNFMCSFYPRTRIVQFNAMLSYQEAEEKSQTLIETFDIYYSRIARLVVENLDSVRREKPLLKDDRKILEILYQWALTFPGGGIDQLLSNSTLVDQILATKIKKGLA
jgi:hypothetical protein